MAKKIIHFLRKVTFYCLVTFRDQNLKQVTLGKKQLSSMRPVITIEYLTILINCTLHSLAGKVSIFI